MFPSMIEITIEQATKALLDASVEDRHEILCEWSGDDENPVTAPAPRSVAAEIAVEGGRLLAKETFIHGPAKFGLDAFAVVRGPIADALGSSFDHSALRGVIYARRVGIVEVCGRLRDLFLEELRASLEAGAHLEHGDKVEVVTKSKERRMNIMRLTALACGCELWFRKVEHNMAANANGAAIRWEPDLILKDGSKGSGVGA